VRPQVFVAFTYRIRSFIGRHQDTRTVQIHFFHGVSSHLQFWLVFFALIDLYHVSFRHASLRRIETSVGQLALWTHRVRPSSLLRRVCGLIRLVEALVYPIVCLPSRRC
jgi:hypothetical protein